MATESPAKNATESVLAIFMFRLLWLGPTPTLIGDSHAPLLARDCHRWLILAGTGMRHSLAEQGFVAPNGLPYSASAVQSMVGE